MKILQELMSLKETEAAAPIEIADVAKNFPNKKREAVIALLSKGRLEWHGKEIIHELYPELEEIVGGFIEEGDGYAFEESMDVPDGEDDVLEVTWENKLDKRDMQEVYLAYDALNDEMIIGYDVWTNEEDFNEGFDDAWRKEHGGGGNEEEVFGDAWEQYKANSGFYGMSFRIKPNGSIEEDFPPTAGGFYKSVHKLIAKNENIVEIRLD